MVRSSRFVKSAASGRDGTRRVYEGEIFLFLGTLMTRKSVKKYMNLFWISIFLPWPLSERIVIPTFLNYFNRTYTERSVSYISVLVEVSPPSRTRVRMVALRLSQTPICKRLLFLTNNFMPTLISLLVFRSRFESVQEICSMYFWKIDKLLHAFEVGKTSFF